MARINIVALFGVLMAGVVLSATVPEKLESQIQIIENNVEFKAANPDTQLMKFEKKDEEMTTLVYSMGTPGHPLVAYGADSAYWETPQNVHVVLDYPVGGGLGAVVTYVHIVVNQTSNLGDAYVMDGGIGFRFITIAIEAFSTYSFSYEAQFYGYY